MTVALSVAVVVLGCSCEGSTVFEESFLQIDATATKSLKDLSEFVRLENGKELEAFEPPSGALSRSGFEVQAIHTLHETDSHLVLRRHGVAAAKASSTSESGGGGSTTGAFQTEREKVLTFLNLNVIASPRDYGYSDDVVMPIIDEGDSNFGSNISSIQEEHEAWWAVWDEAHAQVIRAAGSSGDAQRLVSPDGNVSDPTSWGVHAIEFTRPGFGRVLCFRGTYGFADMGNAVNWIVDWVEHRMTWGLRTAWSSAVEVEPKLGHLPPVIETRGEVANDMAVVRGTYGFLWNTFIVSESTAMKNRAASGADPTLLREQAEEVSRTGYWVFTKAMVDGVFNSLAEGEALYLTGHSQGGSRAALASMYLKKKYNARVEALTFGSIGGGCWSQKLSYSQASLTADVDPTRNHDQVTEYVHVLDPLGHLDLNVGRTCTYGVTGISSSRAAKYCREPYSHSGPTLALAAVADPPTNLTLDYSRCRYFTHSLKGMRSSMQSETFLLENGKTDGGCKQRDLMENVHCPFSLDD